MITLDLRNFNWPFTGLGDIRVNKPLRDDEVALAAYGAKNGGDKGHDLLNNTPSYWSLGLQVHLGNTTGGATHVTVHGSWGGVCTRSWLNSSVTMGPHHTHSKQVLSGEWVHSEWVYGDCVCAWRVWLRQTMVGGLRQGWHISARLPSHTRPFS